MEHVVYDEKTFRHSNWFISFLWEMADYIIDMFPKNKKKGEATVIGKDTRKEPIPHTEDEGIEFFSSTFSMELEEPRTTLVDYLKVKFETKDNRGKTISVTQEFEVSGEVFRIHKIGSKIAVNYLIHQRNGLIAIELA